MLSITLEQSLYVILRELPSLGAKHLFALLESHVDLIANWHETFCKMPVVLHHHPYSDHEEVDVAEYEGPLRRIALLLLKH